ncbi:MAG TPA: hypothetical protein PLB01_10975 [Thermoanaerobaculia bacterium]|nr:hypothetical protein [Thermoanaerobaculia bacterium]
MRNSARRPAFAVSALLLSAAAGMPAAGTVQSIKYSYPGTCRAMLTAGPTDPVTLIFGEPLDLEIAGSGLEGATGGGSSPKQAAPGPRVVTPDGVEGAVLESSAKAMKIRLLYRRGDPPRRSSPPAIVRIVQGSATLGELFVRLAARPQIDRIRLAIPAAASLTTVALSPNTTFDLDVVGRGIAELEIVTNPRGAFQGLTKTRDGSFAYVGNGPKSGRLGPEAFFWPVDGCPVKGPPDAGLDVETGGNDGWTAKIEGQLEAQNATCGAGLRTSLPSVWCASLPAAKPRSEAVVDAPRIRWTLTAKPGVIVGAFDAVLKANASSVDTKKVPFILPGQSVSFETPRTDGRRRRVFTEQACPGCWDLGGVPPWTESAWTVEIGSKR